MKETLNLNNEEDIKEFEEIVRSKLGWLDYFDEENLDETVELFKNFYLKDEEERELYINDFKATLTKTILVPEIRIYQELKSSNLLNN